jgi:hypothetical protein
MSLVRIPEKHLRIVPCFFDRAEQLRAVFDTRFQSPRTVGAERFVWDYWHLPGQYTYLRTFAQAYFPRELWAAFSKRLRSWGEEQLGCVAVTEPWLSYYVDGCRQELHADVPQGPWAYVFSLTRWDQRSFKGGETVLLKPSGLDYWRELDRSRGREMDDLIEHIPPVFNQLTVFDPRIPHGVSRVEGNWDPMQSRIVVHGWFKEPRLRTEGTVDLELAQLTLEPAWSRLRTLLAATPPVQGLVIARLPVDGGNPAGVAIVSETLVPTAGDPAPVAAALTAITTVLSGLAFPPEAGAGELFVPIRLPLP